MKISQIEQLYGSLKHIPKTELDKLSTVSLPTGLASILEHAPVQDTFTDTASFLEHTSALEHSTILGDTIAGVGNVGYGLSLLTRLIEPIKDVSNGNISAAIKRTAVNAVDLLAYKVRVAYAALGAIRGLVVKMRGADTPDAGFIKGYFHAMRHWGKGRRNVENALISPIQFLKDLKNDPLKAQYEKYHTEREDWLNKHRNAILNNSEKNKASIDNWGMGWVQYLEASQEQLNQMISRENSFQEVYSNEKANYDFMNNELIYKLEKLKTLQKKLYADYTNFINGINAMLTTLPDASEEKEVLSNLGYFSSSYCKNEINDINKTILLTDKILKLNETMYEKTSLKGFERIAGYDDIKQILMKKFIVPIAQFDIEKKTQIPNVILFYGPKGCGKTLFANALSDETKSNVIKIELTLDSNDDYKNLQKAVAQAKNTYKIDGKHTIIQIDEIDGFLSDKSFKPNDIENLVQVLSDNNCTIIATTNYPEKVNKNFLTGQGVAKIYIEPPNKKNIQEVLKYYMKDFTDFEIDYQSLSNILQSKICENLYSNAKIAESIMYALKETLLDIDSKLNQQYFENIIAKIEPDIAESNVKRYKGKDAL